MPETVTADLMSGRRQFLSLTVVYGCPPPPGRKASRLYNKAAHPMGVRRAALDPALLERRQR